MPSSHILQLPAQGTPSSTPNTGGDVNINNGPWSYNDVLHIITHKARACNTCSAWAAHYTMSAINNDDTFRCAKNQHENAIRAPLFADNVALRDENQSLRRRLDLARDELARLRKDTRCPRDADEEAEEPRSPPKRQRLSWAQSGSTGVTSVPNRNVSSG